MAQLEIHEIAINILQPADYNPRRLTKKQAEDIRRSIEEFGFIDPIVVNKHPDRKNVIVGGHQRVKVAGSMGYKFVPAVFVNLDLDKERELNVRLNKNGGEWDFEALANQFDVHELIDWGFSSEELGGADSPDEITDEEYLAEQSLTLTIECRDLLQMNELYEELRGRNLTVKMKG